MKKLLLTLLVAVMSITAWAGDVVYKTATFSISSFSTGVQNYTSSFSSTTNGFQVDLVNFNNNNKGWDYVKTGNKSNASVGTITTNTAIDKAVTKVVVTIDAVTASNVNSITLYSGTSASACTVSEGTFTIKTGAQTVAISSPTENKFYKISFDCKKGSSNGLVQVSKVQYYYNNEDGGGSTPDPTPSVTAPTFDVAAGTYNEDQLVLIKNYNGDYLYAYTLDGTDPAFDANLDVTNGTAYDNNEGIEITSSCTLKAIAVDEDGNLSSITSATYVILEPFASLEDLVAADLATNTNVTVSFENVPIKAFQTVTETRKGVYFDIQKGGKDIEIYYNAEIPAEWEEGGTLSGTLTNCPWKFFSGTWELAPTSGWSWENLSYTAPDPSIDRDAVKRVEFANLGYASWGKNAAFSGSQWDNLEQTVDGVKFNYDRNSGSTYANTSAIRFYKSNDLKFTAPDGYAITDITWTGSAFKADVTTDVQTCASTTSALSWSGLAKSVTFTRPSNADGYITLSAVSVTINKIFESTLSEGYTSICFNYNAEIVDDNTAAYAVSAINGNSLVLTAVDVMKANKGYIVFSNSAENTDIVATTKVADDVVNLLSGVAARTAVAELGIQGTEGFAYPWILNKSHVFVQYTGEFIPANKAYLDGKVLQDAGLSMSASLRLDFEGMEDDYQTAISELSKESFRNVMYDLQGRRANGKGLMIQNGKVVLVK